MTSTNRNNGTPRWLGPLITVVIAVLALAMQWGSVTTKLSRIEAGLSGLTLNIDSLRTDLHSIDARVSYLEGRLNGHRKDPSP